MKQAVKVVEYGQIHTQKNMCGIINAASFFLCVCTTIS